MGEPEICDSPVSNIRGSLISNFDLEVQFFVQKFAQFRSVCNAYDKNLLARLEGIVDYVDEFLEGKPEAVDEIDECVYGVNFEANMIRKSYFCEICKESVMNTKKQILRHINGKDHLDKMHFDPSNSSSSTGSGPEPDVEIKDVVVKDKATPALLLNCDVNIFLMKRLSYSSDTAQHAICQQVQNDILSHLKSEFPKAKCILFGSRLIGLATPTSDADIFLDLENKTASEYIPSRDAVYKRMKKVKTILLTAPEWQIEETVKSARVPLLIVRHIKSNIKCDLSFSNCLGYSKSTLLLYFVNELPIAREFPYMLNLMVVFYFQICKMATNVQLMHIMVPRPVFCGPWQISFSPRRLPTPFVLSYRTDINIFYAHLRGFLKFYETFDFSNYIICPYTGAMVTKNIFSNKQAVQLMFPSYYNFTVKNPDCKINVASCCVIQDPIELSCNVSKGINENTLKSFQEGCTLSLKILDDTKK